MSHNFNRRNFLGFVGLAGLTASLPSYAEKECVRTSSFLTLFQGDSITDGNRGRSEDPNHILGHGFAFSVASTLGSGYPKRHLSFMNRGTSGDTIAALTARWQTDTLNYRPDVINILVGVNDVLFRIHSGKHSVLSGSKEELKVLLETTLQSLPHTKIVLCEPFILPVGMVEKNRDLWLNEIGELQKTVKTLADEYKCIFVPFQKVFSKAVEQAPPEYWIWDGIHPTYNGHGLMTREWIKVVGGKIPELSMTM
jgi:lysophospholipase L1-like esterase